MEKNFAVVCTYSFDDDTAVYLFKTEQEAVDYLRRAYEEELKIDEENGNANDSEISENGWYAKIINYRRCGDTDLTEYRIGRIYYQ